MATALQIVRRALLLCTVIDAQEAVPALEGQDGLDRLNALLAELHAANVGVPDYEFDSLSDVLASDAADREALSYMLAVRIAPEFGKALSAEVAKAASESEGRLRLRYFQPGRVDFSELPSCVPTFDILIG